MYIHSLLVSLVLDSVPVPAVKALHTLNVQPACMICGR